MYDPTIGRFVTTDPSGFSAGDADLYRFEGDNPINRTDPTGLEWLDKDHHPVGYWVPAPSPFPAKEPDCVGAALGINQALAGKQLIDKNFVPAGCREATGEGITKWITPCKKGETELIVAWVVDKKTGQPVIHAVGRDRDSLVLTWRSKMGLMLGADDFTNPNVSQAVLGNWVEGISNYQAHFEWYFMEVSGAKPEDIHYRVFCCDKSKLSVTGGNLK